MLQPIVPWPIRCGMRQVGLVIGGGVDHRRCGFSLVELLAVLGIVLVLIGLVIPSLALSRERARRVACAGEMRQLAALVTMYCDENRGYLPFIYSWSEGHWVSPNGVRVPEGYLETSGDYWAYPLLDELGGSWLAGSLLCPNDWVSAEEAAQVSREDGVPIEQVRLPLHRTISRSFYRSPASLRADGLEDTAPMEERRMRLHDVRYPSAKAYLIEDPPFHEDFRVGDVWTIDADLPYRVMVVAVDHSVQLRSIGDAVPAVVPALDLPAGYTGDPEQYFETQRLLNAFHNTRDGVLGRDW